MISTNACTITTKLVFRTQCPQTHQTIGNPTTQCQNNVDLLYEQAMQSMTICQNNVDWFGMD